MLHCGNNLINYKVKKKKRQNEEEEKKKKQLVDISLTIIPEITFLPSRVLTTQ